MEGSRHQNKHQVSLRGASAKEISRDALLEKVMHERELRNYAKRATAAALTVQRVWRGYHSTKIVAEKFRTEWDVYLAQTEEASLTAERISNEIIRPFLFFICRLPLFCENVDGQNDNKRMEVCFRIVLWSVNSSDLEQNFCSLAFASAETHAKWFFQVCKLFSISALALSKSTSSLAIVLSLRLMVALTDIKTWNPCLKYSTDGCSTIVQKLLYWIASREGCLYSSVRDYLFLHGIAVDDNSAYQLPDDYFMITATAITMILRPLHSLQSTLLKDSISCLDGMDTGTQLAGENLCVYILTIPHLSKRIPAPLLPAFQHSSIFSTCLNILMISKESIFLKMSRLDVLKSNAIPSAAWALANIVNLASTQSSGHSGQFISKLNCKDYTLSLCCILNNLAPWIDHNQKTVKENEDVDSYPENLKAETEDEVNKAVARINLGNTCSEKAQSLIEYLRPFQMQWHLCQLLSSMEDEIAVGEGQLREGSLKSKLELQDVALLYFHLLNVFSSFNTFGGLLPILNVLAFSQGFLKKLWNWLEFLVLPRKPAASTVGKQVESSFKLSENQSYSTINTEEVIDRNASTKWASVLLKMKGKPSSEGNKRFTLKDNNSQKNESMKNEIIVWDVPSMKKGPLGLSKDQLTVLCLFCATYAHLLMVIDDDEFYEKQVPFSLEQQRMIAASLNTMVYNGFLSKSVTFSSGVMDAAVRCLYFLYERDCRRSFCPPTLWLAPAEKYRPPIAAAARAHEAVSSHLKKGESSVGSTMGSMITTVPYVFPFEERVQMFREFVKADKVTRRMTGEVVGPGPGSIEISVRRDHIVEDGFRQLNSLGAKLKSSINVSFVNECGLPEAGLDYGGLSKEFLTDLAKAAFDPRFGLFMQTSTDERLLFPNPVARYLGNGLARIEFLGRIVGKALYEGILLDYSFSHAFVRKLLGRYSFLDELSGLDPELHKNLIYLKHYEGDVQDLSLDFTVTEEIFGKRVIIELRQGGANIAVTNENRLQYVHAMADYKLNRQIQPLIKAFNRGLSDLISPSWLSLFNAREFNQLLSGGEHDFDVDDLRCNTRYTGGYSESSRTVKLFWEVVKELEPADRCSLLKFVTSCSRAPLLGFKFLQPAFTIHKVACDTAIWAMIGGQDVERLPSASTCYNTLKLPTYKRLSTIKSKLLYAIRANAGFELS